MRSKVDVSQLNLSHGTKHIHRKNKETKLKTRTDMLSRNCSVRSPWSQSCGKKCVCGGKNLWNRL